MLEISLHMICGMMVGAEYLNLEEHGKVFVLDLFIIRITFGYTPVEEEGA